MTGRPATPKTILEPSEITICENLAKLNIKLVSQRAQALLLINEGQTQAKAAETSGLTIGQVRYLMIIFRKNGINLFPEKLLAALNETKPENPAPKEAKVKKEKKPAKKKAGKKVKNSKKTKKAEPKKKKVKKEKKVDKKSKKKKKKRAKK